MPLRFSVAARFVVLAMMTFPGAATAATDGRGDAPQRLGVFVGTGYLGSPGLSGAALAAGLRFLAVRHVAVSFDLGYGLEARNPDVQDRWWLMPSVAWVAYPGRARLEVGVGLGLGATSGYASWSDYGAAPFGPIWAFQLVPTARGHVLAATRLTRTVDLFARVDVASLLVHGNSVGSRVGNPRPDVADTIWYGLFVGVQLGVL